MCSTPVYGIAKPITRAKMIYFSLSISISHLHTCPYPCIQTLGCVSLGIGLWLYIERNEYATFSEGRDLLGSVFLIAVGFGVIIIGFLGVVAAVWESTVIAGVVSPCSHTTCVGSGGALVDTPSTFTLQENHYQKSGI